PRRTSTSVFEQVVLICRRFGTHISVTVVLSPISTRPSAPRSTIASPFELVLKTLPVSTVAPVWALLPLIVTEPCFTVSVPVQSWGGNASSAGLFTSGAANELKVKTVATAIIKTRLIAVLGKLVRNFIFPP